MSRYTHSPNQITYYLVCDPATGEVVIRTRKWNLQLSHLIQIRVTCEAWKHHRAGDQLDASHIHEPELGKWIAACEFEIRKSKLKKRALKELEKLDHDSLGTWG